MRYSFTTLLWLLSAFGTLPACASPLMYSAEPIEASIVDAQTEQPLEGAVVVAHWVLEGGIHVDRVGELMILETVTDKKGRFRFPAWGPIRHWGRSRLTYMDPEIIIFKSGYEYRLLANETTKEAIGGKAFPVRRSQWNGKTIELKRFKGTREEYARHLGSLSLGWAYNGDECEWKKIPRMILAAHEQALLFKSQKIASSLYTIDNLIPYKGHPDKCGAKEYFKEYMP